MADNYLENKFEQLQARQGAKPVKRVNVSLDTLLKRNRSYRGYDTSRVVTLEQLKELAAVSCFCGSGQNRQQLRFRLVAGADSDKVLPLIKLGAALPQEHLPKPGTEPRAFIVVCSTGPENKVVDIDLGIAAQSILLKAVEKGLNCIFILGIHFAGVRYIHYCKGTKINSVSRELDVYIYIVSVRDFCTNPV